jgi:signal transduction histidine kinase
VTTLATDLRDSSAELRAVLEAKGGCPQEVASEIDALVSALEHEAAGAVGPTTDTRRAVGEAVFDWLERRGLEPTVHELRIVHEWVLAGVAAQIEELTEARRTAARTEERLRFILPNARIIVGEIDSELRFRWINDPTRIPDGGTMVGRNIRDFGDPTFAEHAAAIVERVIRTGIGERVELSPPNRSNPEHVLASFQPTRDASGAISGVLFASTDVTELKKAEIALAQAGAFREQMLAVLAHDLRNPLSSVLALSRMYARNEEVPPKVQHALARIDLASQRMVELIGRLVDFSAARFGETLPIVRADIDLLEVARAVVDELRPTVPARTIELHVDGDTRGAWDPARMAQIVSNLVANALTHGGAHEPVHVHLEGRDGHVLLAVRNRGPIIAPDALPLLFEPFRRGGDPNARPRGLGLGLYIVQELVKAHGGSIAVESTAERGTVFTVDVPRGP